MTTQQVLDVLSIGDANIDLLMGVPHHPNLKPEGDFGSGIRGTWYHLGPGGVATNVAAVLATLGNRVGFVGVVGDDELGQTLRQSLAQRGIDVSRVHIVQGQPTSLLCCFENQEGLAVFYACPGPRRIPAESLDEEYLASARLLFVAGNMLTQDETTGRLLVEAVSKARRRGVLIAVDPSKFWLNEELTPLVRAAIAEANVLLPNANEAELLTGHSSPLAAARQLVAEGCSMVAVKAGEAGCVVCTPEEEMEVPAFATEARARLGAGDAFNGGFLHGYLRGWPTERLARFANATASLKMRQPGTHAGLPSEKAVEAFLAGYRGDL